jgi:hypothetical protein
MPRPWLIGRRERLCFEQVKVLVQDLARNRLDEELRSGSAKMIVVKLHQVPRLIADSDQAAVFVAKRLHWRDVARVEAYCDLAKIPFHPGVNRAGN